jgi:hypothetical protein
LIFPVQNPTWAIDLAASLIPGIGLSIRVWFTLDTAINPRVGLRFTDGDILSVSYTCCVNLVDEVNA